MYTNIVGRFFIELTLIFVYEDEDNAGNMDQDESRTGSRSGAFFVMFIWYFFIIWYLCENVGKLVLRNNIGNMHRDNHDDDNIWAFSWR